mmetsp:Transcript_124107/g.358885  ORF Transcript_124107/g.358885 Transcript_124107/m.358885 type:complete len:221 (-) Transcript_124107:291-953(-)
MVVLGEDLRERDPPLGDGRLGHGVLCRFQRLRNAQVVPRHGALLPHHLRPLAQRTFERAIERRAAPVGVPQQGVGRDRDAVVGELQEVATDILRQLPIVRPERDTSTIPTQVAQASQGLGLRIHPDVARRPLLPIPTRQREGTHDVLDTTELAPLQELLHLGLPWVVHEHRIVHPLHARVPAGLNAVHGILESVAEGLFAVHVLLRPGRLEHPLLTKRGR